MQEGSTRLTEQFIVYEYPLRYISELEVNLIQQNYFFLIISRAFNTRCWQRISFCSCLTPINSSIRTWLTFTAKQPYNLDSLFEHRGFYTFYSLQNAWHVNTSSSCSASCWYPDMKYYISDSATCYYVSR